MCGIAGILKCPDANYDPEPLILGLKASLRHRGPDDEGVYISPDRMAALAHTRLSIIDTGSGGHQPMSLGEGRYWITFNGEIYNYRQLRNDLEAGQEPLHSESDTEVLLRLYQRYGPECLKRLRGMFAFAIWDDHEKTCFIARDPLGIKPLYYWHQGSHLAFASEVRSLLQTGLPARRLSPQGVFGYIANGSVPEPYTIVDEIQCLPAAHCIVWKKGELTAPTAYWQITFPQVARSGEDVRERVREALLDSLRHHFVADVPVSIFLSGGIDSSALVALSHEVYGRKLQTYSIAFQEPEFNEGVFARAVADKFETEHSELLITESSARAEFQGYMATMDQPSVDGFNSYCISRMAHQHGSKVVLSGLGGDELFGGYPSFRRVPGMMAWSQALHSMHLLNPRICRSLEPFMQTHKQKRIFEFFRGEPTLEAAYQAYRGIFPLTRVRDVVETYGPWLTPISSNPCPSVTGRLSPQDAVSFLEISRYMRNQLLRDSDVMSMASSLELRVPFVDHVFLDTIAGIPSACRLAPGKQLLVSAIPELPEWLIGRPKQGFTFPFALWFKNEWSDSFEQARLPAHLKLDYWYQQWTIGALNFWISKNLSGTGRCVIPIGSTAARCGHCYRKYESGMLSVIVLTHNEESFLQAVLNSVTQLQADIFVVDSGSTDGTLSIAERAGCNVFSHPFENYASQRNWALETLPLKTEWVLHLDADERLTPELASEIQAALQDSPPAVAGYLLRRRTVFMGRWIKHGGVYPAYHLRLFRVGSGRCERRLYDQHFIVDGEIRKLKHDFLDVLAPSLDRWTERHNRWSALEAIEMHREASRGGLQGRFWGTPIERRRWLRNALYAKCPLFLRAISYFIYRYVLRLGFLDGTQGLIFHGLQGLWFRFLIDAKLFEFGAKPNHNRPES